MAARFHPDGTSLATGDSNGKVNLWDVRSKMLLQSYPMAPNDQVNAVSFHDSGRYLASAGSDNTLKIYDLRMGQILYGHQGSSHVVNFSNSGKLFATGGSDTNVIVWTSNLVDDEQEVAAGRVKKGYEVSRRAMTGEGDPKVITKFRTGKYAKKTKKVTE